MIGAHVSYARTPKCFDVPMWREAGRHLMFDNVNLCDKLRGSFENCSKLGIACVLFLRNVCGLIARKERLVHILFMARRQIPESSNTKLTAS
jgi:hypothetical protein